MSALGSRLVIPFAVVASAALAVAKLAAARHGGSAVMLSEGIHSVIDVADGAVLLLAAEVGRRVRRASRPFAHDRAVFLASLLVGAFLFTGGAAFAISEGIDRLRQPAAAVAGRLDLVVLGAAALIEGAAFVLARRGSRENRALAGLTHVAALLGLGMAAAGLALGRLTGSPLCDAWASIGVGGVLAAVATVLAREAWEGFASDRGDVVLRIRASAASTPGLSAVNRVLTMQLGPQRILVALDVALDKGLTGPDLGRTLRRLEETIRRAHPVVRHVYVDVHAARRPLARG